MKKNKLFSLILSSAMVLSISSTSFANDSQRSAPKGQSANFCADNLYKGVKPEMKGLWLRTMNKTIPLCYKAFNSLYHQNLLMPVYATEVLTKDKVDRGDSKGENVPEYVKKEGSRPPFQSDPNLMKQPVYVDTKDFLRTNWDRGHLVPSRDVPHEDREEAFYMSNIVPQNPLANRNGWEKAETQARCMADHDPQTKLYIVNIPGLDLEAYKLKNFEFNVLPTKAKNIVIPDVMIKVIYNERENQLYYHAMSNQRIMSNEEKEAIMTQNGNINGNIKIWDDIGTQKFGTIKMNYQRIVDVYGIDPFPTLPQSVKNNMKELGQQCR